MKRISILRSVTGGLLLGLLVVSLASCGKTVNKRRTQGYKGEARANAFLAAQRMLENRGEAVVSQSGVGDLGVTASTLFLGPSSLNTVGRTKRIFSWVENGGHLVVMLAAGGKRGNDFHQLAAAGRSYDQIETPGLEYLLGKLNVELVDWGHEPAVPVTIEMDRDTWEEMDEADRVLLASEQTGYSLGGEKMELYHWAGKGLKYDAGDQDDFGTAAERGEGRHRYLSLLHGDGRVSLLADASPLRNRYIAYGDHARFVVELIGMSRDGTVVFSDGGGENFFAMVWRYFWMAVLGLAVVIVFWLWKNLPRFGPPQDLPESEVREFSGQLCGIGRFLWRHKRDDVMLASLRASASRKLSINAEGNHEGVYEQLAERTGLPLESVTEAMTRTQVREPGVMVRVVKNLQKISKTIN